MKRFDIVIVGGGFCGFLVAKKLEKLLPEKNIALLELRKEFEYTPSIMKIITDKKYAEKITIPYTTLKRTTVLHEPAQKLHDGKIISNKKTYTYDFAVICSGAHTPCPLKSEQVFVLKSVQDAFKIHDAIQNAKRVVVVGGGLVGVEVAGELCTKKRKHIVLVEPGERLLRRNSEQVSQHFQKYLEQKGCMCVFGERVTQFKNKTVITQSGKNIAADIVIWCAGIGVDTLLRGGACVNDKGCVLVDEYLRVKGLEHVFAGGDITDVPEEKTAQSAEQHAEVIAENILQMNSSNPQLTSHTPHSQGLLISTGDWHAVFVRDSFFFSGIIPALMKRFLEWWVVWKLKH